MRDVKVSMPRFVLSDCSLCSRNSPSLWRPMLRGPCLFFIGFSFGCMLFFSLQIVHISIYHSQPYSPSEQLQLTVQSNSKGKGPPQAAVAAVASIPQQIAQPGTGSDAGTSTSSGNGNGNGNSTTIGSARCLHEMPTTSNCKISATVQYWSNPTDCYESPLRKVNGLQAPEAMRRYVVFQPDLGGWNNIRMALEVVILFALVTGRILVMPPDAVLYLLSKNKKWKDNFSNMDDYFNFDLLKANNGLEVIPMVEFLALITKNPSQYLENNTAPMPPLELLVKQPLWDFFETTCYWRQWSPGKKFLVFGNGKPGKHERLDNKTSRYIRHSMNYKRMPVAYESFANKTVIFFAGHDRNRMLTLFYGYLYMMHDADDRLVKRYVRDRMRYHDKIFCVGGGIVDSLNSGSEGRYAAFHIRRGDFQHKHTQWSAQQIIDATSHLLLAHGHTRKQSVYISTDEGNLSFFDPFKAVFHRVFFLSNFSQAHNLDALDQNHLGMVEQVICAGAYVFIGTPLSTFTGYISRMRGYKNRTSLGIYERTYYFMPKHMLQLHRSPHLALPMWPREYIEAFEGIDEI